MSAENINRPISFEKEEDNCSDSEEIVSDMQQAKWIKKRDRSASCYLFWETRLTGLNPEFTVFQTIYCPGNS